MPNDKSPGAFASLRPISAVLAQYAAVLVGGLALAERLLPFLRERDLRYAQSRCGTVLGYIRIICVNTTVRPVGL
jgi:hypothetical protein